METMTINYDDAIADPKKKMSCEPDTLHVPKFSREDILLILDDKIVDDYDFAEGAKAIVFKIGAYGKRFSQHRLNNKTLWLHDNNTEDHPGNENAKFTIKITNDGDATHKVLDPQVINE